MSIPAKVVQFLRQNPGSFYCSSCLAQSVQTTSHVVTTIQETLGFCTGFTPQWGPCPACHSARNRNLIKAD